MGWLKKSHEQSMLGQLLVRQRLISEEQLAQAIAHQSKTGQRLGDIFAEWNLITRKHVQDALHTQRNLRLAATICTALLAPLEAFAAVPVAPATPMTAAVSESSDGMRVMSEEELGNTAAQGLSEGLARQLSEHNRQHEHKNDGLAVLGGLAQTINPLLGLLQADVSMKDVVYDPTNATSVINPDGSITLRMPSTIGEIHFDNIRIKGASPDAPSFGSITMRDIDFRGTTIVVKPK